MDTQLYLASASPRRRELLAQIGVHYQVLSVAVDESLHANEAPELYVVRLALAKALAGVAQGVSIPVLGADTAVVIGDTILGKPRDQADALQMLARLSGTMHHVYSGLAVVTPEGEAYTRLSVTQVHMRDISAEEAQAYWQTGEPADKAGGYAIQGMAAKFVERIEGSYSGVMGLPLYETAEVLRELGLKV